jgi:hypothetical protein
MNRAQRRTAQFKPKALQQAAKEFDKNPHSMRYAKNRPGEKVGKSANISAFRKHDINTYKQEGII